MMAPTPADNAARPALLLVHGSWLGAWSWEKVQPKLTARGWEVHTVDLPSVADLGGPRFGLHDDAAVVRERIREIGRPVVVVAHSYGGVVATQAAAGLSNVRHIVYVCAFVLDIGESLIELSGRVPWWKFEGDTTTPLDSREILFNDVPQEDSDRAIARLRPFTYKAVTETLTAAAWRSVPSTYVVCEDDVAVTSQDAFAARTTRVRRLPTGHMPLLSMPSELTDLIVEAAETA
ncbi:alpha/beta hydrolase [Mycobacterium sp. UM_CSW]|uniref:alpha/beta fold hydrolase n=1 Tax=Mycobacterium sp. UM_CSW TaxID=1370119 RepID=UPI0009DBE5C1|nr:alpha/beta hydrolase [Mycobacterium sp. UM_CSW]